MSGKIKMVYDATLLANGIKKNSGRTGIYFVGMNLLRQFLKRDDLSVKLCCRPECLRDLKTVLESDFSDCELQILDDSPFMPYQMIKQKRTFYRDNKQVFKKIICQLYMCICSPILKLIDKRNKNNADKVLVDKINESDIYFSPCFASPVRLKIKSCTVLHDLIPKLLPDHTCLHWRKGEWLFDLCETLNADDYYFTNSDATKNDFLKCYSNKIDKNKIKTVLLACDEKFKPQEKKNVEQVKKKYDIPQDKKYIFSLCTLEPRKNLIRAVKTFVEFVKKNHVEDLVFVLGGGHWDDFISKLEQEIENLETFKSKIIKIGYVDDEDLPALYSGAEWFTYTSMYEGFGLPPLEAMSCGCPVITSNNSSIPEVVGDAGIMIDWDSDEQHIRAYEKYYFDKKLRTVNSKKGLERAKQFSWEKCADEMMEVIKNSL